MNISAPINNTGYGIASINIVRSLYNIDNDISFFPINHPSVDNENDHELFTKLISNSILFDIESPYLKIWHQFDLASHIGKGRYFAYPFFELDTFDKREVLHLSVPDTVIVSSSWAKSILIDNGIKTNCAVAPLGVDCGIFDYRLKNTDDNKYIFANIGKWEIRKGHDILYQIFSKAFPNQKDVELRILASEKTNSYSSPEDLTKWKNLYSRDPRIKIYNGVDSHSDIANFISHCDCGIFPSRAEGWNLELLEFMAMNKPTISTDYSAHTEFCNSNNCYLIDIDETEQAYDGKAFVGQGRWAKIGDKQIDQIIDYMRYCYSNNIRNNPEGIKTANKFSWQNTANIIYGCMYN